MNIPFKLSESTAMFNYVRLAVNLVDSHDRIINASILRNVRDCDEEKKPSQMFSLDERCNGIIEAFIDRSVFPQEYRVETLTNNGTLVAQCKDLVEEEKNRLSRSSLDYFLKVAGDWKRAHDGTSPKVLDIGGRARSGYLLADHLPGCDVTVLDIHPGQGVDIVADIHEMSHHIGADRFDFIICVSVFEHLIMPWKAAIEMNKVLTMGGIAFVQTHQTVGLHDRPWDYFRFSDDSWKGIFNAATGYEVVETQMNNFVRITPMHYFAIERESEKMGGFYESAVVVRKISQTQMDWPVPLHSIIDTHYPA